MAGGSPVMLRSEGEPVTDRPTVEQIDAEISRRISELHRLAEGRGSKMSKMKMRAQASALSELLGWTRGKKRHPSLDD